MAEPSTPAPARGGEAPALAAWTRLAHGDPLPLLKSEAGILLGINAFEPGEVFPNHRHEVLDETFLGLEGEVELWLDRERLVVLAPGVVHTVPAGVEHLLRNTSATVAVIGYLKSPDLPDDRVLLEWSPGEDITRP